MTIAILDLHEPPKRCVEAPIAIEKEAGNLMASARSLFPGYGLAAGVGVLAVVVGSGVQAVPSLLLGLLAGIAATNVLRLPARFTPGLQSAASVLLRAAVVLLGLRIAPEQVVALGWSGFAVVAALAVATIAIALAAGSRGDAKGRFLLGAGFAICGASAIAAVAGTLKSRHEDVVVGIALVTICGTLATLLYPFLGPVVLSLDASQYGRWVGASVHDLGQVVAAASTEGDEAVQMAVVVKMARVALLVPLLVAASIVEGRATGGEPSADGARGRRARWTSKFPLFVVGFVATATASGLGLVPSVVSDLAGYATSILFAAALFAVGAQLQLRGGLARASSAVAIGVGLSLFLSVGSLAAIELGIL